MSDVLEGLDVPTQITIWGAAYSGDLIDTAAVIAETRPNKESHLSEHPWDRTARDLARIERWHGEEQVAVPEWWALPLVVDDVMR